MPSKSLAHRRCLVLLLLFGLTLSRPHGLRLARFLCPRDSPGKNTGVGWHFFFQEIFLTRGLNPHLLR